MSLLSLKRGSAVAVALAVLGSMLAPTTALAAEPPAVVDEFVTLESGHIDAFKLTLNEANNPLLALGDDSTGSYTLRTPESVELFVKPQAKQTVPADFLPGMPTDIYHLPLSQDANLIWPGWDTNELTSAFPGANTDIVVESVQGPGTVYLWSSTPFGQPKSLLKDGGYTLPSTISQPYPAHAHAAWAFTAPGTYNMSVRAQVASADGTKTSASNTATYTFVVAERSKLTPEAPVRVGNTVTIPAQTGVAYVDGDGAPIAAGEHPITESLTVRATPLLGYELASGQTSEWNFAFEEQVMLSLTGLKPDHQGHYHQYSNVTLNAVAAPAVPDATYEWFVQRKDQDAPVKVAGKTAAKYGLTLEQAHDGATFSVNMLANDGKILASAAVGPIGIDDHGAKPLNNFEINPPTAKLPLQGWPTAPVHYEPGEQVDLTAKFLPATVLNRFVWEMKLASTETWTVLSEQQSAPLATSFTATPEMNGAQLRVRLLWNTGEEYLQTRAPMTLEVPQPIETTLSITGVGNAYKAGDTATLAAKQDPETGEDHYHWFMKRTGAKDFTVIDGELSGTLKYVLKAEDLGAQVIARLYSHDHEVIAESKPVTLTAAKEEPNKCEVSRSKSVFTDVAPGQKFYKEIDWMHCAGLTTGTKTAGGVVFAPKQALSREAMAAFMFRLEGDKKYVAPKVSPFADVKPGDKFFREIAWMAEKKLSTGTRQVSGKPVFKPKDELSREAMAAFMYRLEKPKGYVASKGAPFVDVKPGAKFYTEVSWMYDVKLSTGTRVGAERWFKPKDELSREAMAAFMYRLVTDYRK